MSGDTIPSFIAARAALSDDASAAFYRVDAVWRPVSLASLLQMSERVARSLSRLGLEPNDRLAIMCRTRVEWLLAELAAMTAGVVVVGIDAHASGAQIAQILDDSKASALIVDAEVALSRIPTDIRARLSLVVAIERGGGNNVGSVPRLLFWDELIDELGPRGRWGGLESSDEAPCDKSRQRHTAADCIGNSAATLLYTSGTTGRPKGILYRQEQLAVACRAILNEFPSVAESRGTTICWLPMAALFQRMMNYVALASGVAIYFLEDPGDVVRVAREVQPSYFIGVPRFFEKLHRGIQQELATRPPWLRKLVESSLARTPEERLLNRRRAMRVPGVIRSLVLRKFRGVLGHHLRFIITGSAPTPIRMLEYFDQMGILLLEAYALSENTVPIAANRPEAFRFGSVGQVFAANDLRIAADGEILVRGPGLFDGYVGNEPASADLFTEDGFYRTDDLGRIDGDGFLYITGRKSEIFKTSTGRWVAPAQVETIYKKIPYVEQIVVVGRGRHYPVALLTIDERLLASLRGRERSAFVAPGHSDPASTTAVRAWVEADFEAVGSELAPHERIHRFEFLPAPLTLEGGELTPSLKVRREVIERKYGSLIDRLYVEKA